MRWHIPDCEEVRPMTRDELMHYGTKRHSGRYLPVGLW